MVCVVNNEGSKFCWPFPGGEIGRKSQSMNKGVISEGRGKSGHRNHGFLVPAEKSSSEYVEYTRPGVPKRDDKPLQNHHKFT